MSPETLLALFGILAAATWTPGPNNMMLASSGVTFGLRATTPHIAGVALGFGFMLFAVALGFASVFDAVPVLNLLLKWGGSALLIWVAWRIATTGAPDSSGPTTTPFRFWQAAAFQWVNPKGWAMCIALVGQFMHPENRVLTAGILAGVSIITGTTSAIGWAVFGNFLRRWLKSPVRLKAFNVSMAGVILFGTVFVLWAEAGP